MQKKPIAILIVVLALITTACRVTSPPKTATPTPAPEQPNDTVFTTPDEAISYYFAGLADVDVHKILRACAINEMSEKFRFDLYTDRLKVLLPVQSLSPSDYPMYVESNKMQLSAQISNQVKILAYSLLSSEAVDEGKLIQIDTQRTNTFMKDVDPKRLAQVAVKKIGLPNKTLMNEASYQENAAKIAGIYGADESTERVALFTFEGNYYYLGFTLLRYGENWKISSQTSPLAGTSVLGAPQKITPEEFDSMIGGN